jgi:alpha-glucosidase/alpha-D-xyloside xylohydrolase
MFKNSPGRFNGKHATGSALFQGLAFAALALLLPAFAIAQDSLVLERDGHTISLVPYGPNIVRVSLGVDKAEVLAEPGYGFVAKPAPAGWSHEHLADGSDTYRSARMIVSLAPANLPKEKQDQALPLDAINSELRDQYFGGSPDPYRPHPDALRISTPEGRTLLQMRSWTMAPERADVAKMDANPKGHAIAALFDSPAAEHYYGLGQQQQGWMDLRDHEIQCWHNYAGLGGETLGVPFLVSTFGYGLIWDNPSKTTVQLGFNQRNTWSSEVGNRVSYFVIAGASSDEIYEGYRQLTGVTHLLPRGVYGYTQSKAIYPTQKEILDVAKTYREKKLPLDVIVVDFLNMTKQGELDLDPARWPDAAAMNRELHAMNIHSLLSVWPHFPAGTQFYDMLKSKGWLITNADGQPDAGWAPKTVGPNIDMTNPAAATWFWEEIRDRYIRPFGFDYLWLDETEPDIDPAPDRFSIGAGVRFYNVYPLVHTGAVYEGFRRDFGDSRRVMILARAAYLGTQRNGTVFWSSDIVATWDMLKRSVPAGLNFTASGMAYWDTDIAGFFSPRIPADYRAAHKPLLDGSDAREVIGNYEDYPELFVRWFQWGAFHPVMRAHGERMHNEVWSYGREAAPILEKYLKLRYQLLPYTYSLAYRTYRTGAPYMRALFMDFPQDPKAGDIPDEYMYGPAFLVAPVTEQGATHRSVYLPAGCDWYNYWTNERLHGGQTIEVSAPIDTLPLFVRAGSILPFGSEVASGHEQQALASVRVYPGADASFELYQDDGSTYAYEKDATASQVTQLRWNNTARKLTGQGSTPVVVVGEKH